MHYSTQTLETFRGRGRISWRVYELVISYSFWFLTSLERNNASHFPADCLIGSSAYRDMRRQAMPLQRLCLCCYQGYTHLFASTLLLLSSIWVAIVLGNDVEEEKEEEKEEIFVYI